jgi:hypothetical protein
MSAEQWEDGQVPVRNGLPNPDAGCRLYNRLHMTSFYYGLIVDGGSDIRGHFTGSGPKKALA